VHLGIDWGTRKAAWCSIGDDGTVQEGAVPADQDGLSRLARRLGGDVRGWVEMMSGAPWVGLRRLGDPDRRRAARSRRIAPLAHKTDRVDARVLADLARRDLVPEVWVPSVDERANRERLRRRSHLVGLRTSAINRTFGPLTQWGLRMN
jgi:transposase